MADAPTGQYWLIESSTTRALPDPVELRRMIRGNLEAGYQELRSIQGDVHTPEDTFQLQRTLAASRERFTDWSRAFQEGAKRIAQMQEEQLIEAVGQQVSTVSQVGIDGEPELRGTGVPNQGLTIPDAAGDIRLTVSFETARDFDLGQLIGAVALAVAESMAGDLGEEIGLDGFAALVSTGILQFLELGKFEAQVSKVNAYAERLSRAGDDKAASIVSSAVTSRKTYKGVTMTRS